MTRWLACFIAGLVFSSCTAASGMDLTVVASPWPPYVGPGLQEDGLAVHLATEGLRHAGYRPSVRLISWPRDLEGTEKGRYDVIASVWFNEERAAYLTFSEPYIVNETRFFKRRSAPYEFNTLTDLRGLRIGVVGGYAYGEAFYRESDFTRVTKASVLQNLRSLLAGELDLVLADERVGLFELNINIPGGIRNTAILPKPYATKGLRIGVSKQHTHHEKIAADFDAAVAAMRADGTYASILALHRVSAP